MTFKHKISTNSGLTITTSNPQMTRPINIPLITDGTIKGTGEIFLLMIAINVLMKSSSIPQFMSYKNGKPQFLG